MISGYGAGHTFVNGVCICGRKLVDLRGVTFEDENKEGLAHVGRITRNEIITLNELIKKLDEAVANAMGWK